MPSFGVSPNHDGEGAVRSERSVVVVKITRHPNSPMARPNDGIRVTAKGGTIDHFASVGGHRFLARLVPRRRACGGNRLSILAIADVEGLSEN